MDIQQIISSLQSKLGNNFDASKVTSALKGVDIKNMSMPQIMALLGQKGLIGDLDGDGVQESLVDELKGKAAGMVGGLGKLFGK